MVQAYKYQKWKNGVTGTYNSVHNDESYLDLCPSDVNDVNKEVKANEPNGTTNMLVRSLTTIVNDVYL